MAVFGTGGGIGDGAAGGDVALDGVEVFAEVALGRDAHGFVVEGAAEGGVELAFGFDVEGEGLDFAAEGAAGLFGEHGAEAGGVDGDAADAGVAGDVAEHAELLGEGHFAEDLGADEVGDAIDFGADKDDGEVFGAADVHADIEGGIGRDGGEIERGDFAGGDEVVGEEDGGGVDEFAEVFLRPDVGVVDAGAELFDVEGEALADGVVEGDFVLGIGGVFVPEVGELVAHAFGGGDDAQELLAGEGVGDGGVDGGPDVPRFFVDGELVEDEVGGVAAGGVGVGGDGDDAGLVGEGDISARVMRALPPGRVSS